MPSQKSRCVFTNDREQDVLARAPMDGFMAICKNTSILRGAILVVGLSFSSVATASCLIPSYTAVYNTKVEGMSVGNITQTLHVAANKKYVFDSVAKSTLAFFSDQVEESSSGDVIKTGLKPEHYHYSNERLKNTVSISFDWSKSMAHSVQDKKGKTTKASIKIKPGIQDFLSYQLQFQREFRQNSHAKQFSIQLIHKGKVRDYVYSRVKAETIHIPLGDVSATLFQRKTKDGLTQIWFANKKYPGTMVQLHQVQTGKVSLTMQLKSYKLSQPAYCLD